MGRKLELALGVLNGVVGDHLARTGNGLATEMTLVREGRPLPVTRAALSAAYPNATSRVVVLIHGSSNTESVWEFPDGQDYGSMLAGEFAFTPLYLRYNSGLAIADNGAMLTTLLDGLVEHYPVPITEILLLGYSMGGLVIRSACHVARLENRPWLQKVKHTIYVGTPHLGAPLERVGRVVAKVLRWVDDPYTRLAADLANLRSDGVKDLGNADLRHEDRERRAQGVALTDPRHPVPLLEDIQHHFIAGTLSPDPLLAALFGDALVPVPSATNGQVHGKKSMTKPPLRVRILPGSHVVLAHDAQVYSQIQTWCREMA